MQERDWRTLIHSLRQGDCVLVLGPEIPVAGSPDASSPDVEPSPPVGQRPLSLPEKLAQQLSTELDIAGLDTYDLAQVSEFYARKYGRNDLEAQVVSFYREAPRSELCTCLANLPFQLVISLVHHDTGLMATFCEQDKTPIVETYDFRGEQKEILGLGDGVTGTEQQPLIYHLYGHVDVPRSLVVSESDVLHFLSAVISRNPDLPNDLRSYLRDPGKNFLLLGFGLRRWYLQILLHLLKINEKQTRSFALEPFPHGDRAVLQKTVFFMKRGLRVESYDYDVGQFVRDLEARYQATKAKATKPRTPETRPRPVEGSRVFISYASEDEAHARKLFEELRATGFDPWYDKKGLRGGDRWDEVLQEALEAVDYVVVVQSQALYGKTFSYVNKEIHLALERQQFARRGIRYLIPVRFGDCPLLDELKDLQTIDLGSEAGFEQLRTAIERDRQRRRARAL